MSAKRSSSASLAIYSIGQQKIADSEARKKRKDRNQKIGQMMREVRQNAGLSLRQVAAMMGCSAPFVSDLELGNRMWNEDWVRLYDSVCLTLVKKSKK